VEKSLRLSGGFWGSIASGAIFDSMEVTEGRQKPKAKEVSARVIAANRRHLSRAETLVGAFQTVLHEGITPPDRALRQRLQAVGAALDEALVQSAWRGGLSTGMTGCLKRLRNWLGVTKIENERGRQLRRP
jgi:hypothetical protein